MRLRYIHLPDYGPLVDVAVAFQQNTHIENRAGAINFVVGLNGSGKSSLLRAIYDVFHSLSQEVLPKFPVTLAYDLKKGEIDWTIIFHRPKGPAADCFLISSSDALPFSRATDWQDYITQLVENKNEISSTRDYVAGDQLKGDGNLRASLPERVLAYTSGDLAPWLDLSYPTFPTEELNDDPEDFDREQERPASWTAEKEHFDIRIPSEGDPAYDLPLGGTTKGTESIEERCILLQPEDAKLAAISLGIWQAAIDLHNRSESWQQEAYRKERLVEIASNESVEDQARRLLNELDWLWPTHVSFRFSSYAQHLLHPQTSSCYWLLALADAVVAHPLEEFQAVVSLGTRPPLDPYALVGKLDPGSESEVMLGFAARDMVQSTSGAEAIRALFAGEHSDEESLWHIFRNLQRWRSYGLLKDIDLTVKRAHPTLSSDGKPDDRILTYSSFSDGEQMLLGRMALILLLRRQENCLLLLDEPETHFNDAWKRQIIDLVDDGILKDTTAQVLVSTHTSLALTDVFSCEITRLVKEQSVTTAQPVVHSTFGADPGRILLHVFGAPDIIGARAAEFLRSKLDPSNWPPEDREKLRSLVDEIGSSWPRSKLLEILEKLDNPAPPPESPGDQNKGRKLDMD